MASWCAGTDIQTTRAPLLANASRLEQRPPLAVPPDCCCSRRVWRPVARRCRVSVPAVHSGTIARASGCAGAAWRAPSARKWPKQGEILLLNDVSWRVLHAISPSPASPHYLRTLCFTRERYSVADSMLVCERSDDVRVCARGGSDVKNNIDVFFTYSRTPPRAIRAAFLPIFLGRHRRQHRP